MATAARGFTLIELLIVVAISAILYTVALPTFSNMIAGARTYDALGTLQAALDVARSDAIRRGTNVTACRVRDAAANPPVCDAAASGGYAGDDWAAGWVVFVDSTATGAVGVVDAGDEILLRQGTLDSSSGSRAVLLGSAGTVTYAANGLRLPAARVVFNIDYRDAPHTASGQRARCLAVAVMGQLEVSAGACP